MKTSYWLPCACGQRLSVETTQAGTTVHCTCGTELTVPTLHEMSHLELAATAEAARSRRAKPGWGKRQARILLGALVTVVSIALLIYLEISQPRLPRVDSLAPIQVWSLWQDLRRGPDRHLPQGEKQFLDSLRMYRSGKVAALVCAATGLLLMAFSYAIPAPGTPHRAIPGRATSKKPLSGVPPNADL